MQARDNSDMATQGDFEGRTPSVDDALRRTDEQFDRIDARLDQIESVLATLEQRTRHEDLRSWALTGVVLAFTCLLAWLCRGSLASGWQAPF